MKLSAADVHDKIKFLEKTYSNSNALDQVSSGRKLAYLIQKGLGADSPFTPEALLDAADAFYYEHEFGGSDEAKITAIDTFRDKLIASLEEGVSQNTDTANSVLPEERNYYEERARSSEKALRELYSLDVAEFKELAEDISDAVTVYNKANGAVSKSTATSKDVLEERANPKPQTTQIG